MKKGNQMAGLESREHYYRIFLLTIPVLVLLAGCAGVPPGREAPSSEPPPPPPAEEVILDAQLLAQNNEYDSAVSLLKKLVQRERNNIEALRLLASIYTVMGKKNESASIWENISLLDPSDADAAYEVGVVLARKGDWQNVRSKMLAAELSGATDSRHYLLIGEADLELGYESEAEKYLQKANDLERSLYLLGTLYYDQGKHSKAEDAFKVVLQRNPDNYTAHLYLGWLAYIKENHHDALRHYRHAVKLNPGDPLPILSLAGLLDEMGKSADAINYYKQALSLAGIPREERKKVYNSLSRLLVESGNVTEAVSFIKRGLKEFPKSGGLYYQWGMALLKEGNKTEAIEKLKLAANDPVWKDIALRRIHTIQ